MNVKQYFRLMQQKAEDGLIDEVKAIIRGFPFKLSEIVVCFNIHMESPLIREAEEWLGSEHPDAKYDSLFDGLDWFFEDPLVALHFQLRWC
jgi:hypothetical protein